MMKRLLSVAIIATMLCSLLVVPASAKAFPDANGHWAQNAIELWSDRGVVNGDDAGNFRPGDPITRAETAKLIDNLIGFQKTSNKVFSDVDKNAWYASSVNKLYAADVLTGYEDGTIRPGNSISRQEAAVIIARAFALETKKADQGLLAGFSDNDQIQEWARPTIAYMAGLLFVQGSDGMFRPGDPITRAEMVTILNNMIGVYADGSQSTYTGNYGDKIAIVKAPTIFNGVTLGGAVICGTTKGKVNFNSGSKVSGCICNWAPNASVSTAGATVASTANKGGGTISAGGNFNAMSGTTSAAGGSVGGSSGGGGIAGGSSNTPVQQTITFYANGGMWEDGKTQQAVIYNNGNSYALRLPLAPSRTGYLFEGWYRTQAGANTLDSTQKLDTYDIVTSHSTRFFYAGWKKPIGLYGTVAAATGSNVANRGKSAEELMDGVVLTRSADADFYQATGGLRYVTEYTLSPTLNTAGNFLAITYSVPADFTDPDNVILKTAFSDGSLESTYAEFTPSNRSFTRVFEITAADLAKDIIFTVDLVGDGQNVGVIMVDPASLIRYELVTVTTPEEFVAALNNPAAEKITVDAPITLASGTYGPETGKKNLVVNHPISIAKDGAVTLRNLNITADSTVTTLITNATEIPEGETEAVATKAASLTLDSLSVSGSGVLNQLQVKDLSVKKSTLTKSGEASATALVLSAPAEGDTAIITGTTITGYDLALETQDDSLFVGASFRNNILKNNTTDLKLDVADVIPNISYNYFDDAPVIAGTNGAITNFVGPLYTAETMLETDLSENLHDAYIVAGGTLQGKLSQLTALTLTFAGEDTPCEILVIPADVRDTTVSINETEGATRALLKADLPIDLIIQVGTGAAKTLGVTELVSD